MNEYTFRFYKEDKHVTTKTFHKECVEDAYSDADNFLRQNSKIIDDWEYLKPKK